MVNKSLLQPNVWYLLNVNERAVVAKITTGKEVISVKGFIKTGISERWVGIHYSNTAPNICDTVISLIPQRLAELLDKCFITRETEHELNIWVRPQGTFSTELRSIIS